MGYLHSRHNVLKTNFLVSFLSTFPQQQWKARGTWTWSASGNPETWGVEVAHYKILPPRCCRLLLSMPFPRPKHNLSWTGPWSFCPQVIETQRDWFGKKGRLWHIAVAITKADNEEIEVRLRLSSCLSYSLPSFKRHKTRCKSNCNSFVTIDIS